MAYTRKAFIFLYLEVQRFAKPRSKLNFVLMTEKFSARFVNKRRSAKQHCLTASLLDLTYCK